MILSILIVSWNTHDLLAQCLMSIAAHPPHGEYEIIVVDNASADGSAAMVRTRFPEVRLIENAANLGFAGANNQAIDCSRGGYLLLLNPDTVIEAGALAALVDFMDAQPTAGAAGSLLLNADGSLQDSCHRAPTLFRELWRLFHLDSLYPLAQYRMDDWPQDTPRPVDTVQGAALIVRRGVIDRVGMMDPSYFMYSEEVDWCLRIRRAGWQIYWVPQSRIVHYGGQSTRQVASTMFVQLYRGKLQYFRKHYGRVYAALYKVVLLAAAAARVLLMPLVWLALPKQRPDSARLARDYSRLILALPGM